MILFRSTSKLLLFATFLLLSSMTQAKTAIVFGATGTVGYEVLRSVVNEKLFTQIIVVGRREFPPKVKDLLPETAMAFVQKDLGTIDQNESLLELETDACFIAAGTGFPHLSDLHDWHHAEVTVARSIARLCGKMNAKALSVFTAIDSDSSTAEPFDEEELHKTNTPIGWWPVFANTIRMMGLKENAILKVSSGIVPSIRIFLPSNIITKETRYGWLDWALFKFHGVFDEWLPTQYHSVTTELLAEAMVQDTVNVLSDKSDAFDTDDDGAVRLDYGDFLTIVGNGKEQTIGEL